MTSFPASPGFTCFLGSLLERSHGRAHLLHVQHWLYPNHILPSSKKSNLGCIRGVERSAW